MHTTPHKLITLALIAFAMCAFSACGGSSEGGKVIATVGDTEITQAEFNHWMATTVGGNFREVLSEEGPEGLVSDPPDYPRCVAAVKQIVPSSGGRSRLSEAQFLQRCRQLYAAIKEQTLNFLIAALWRIEEEAEHGVRVSGSELTHVLQKVSGEGYSSPAQFRRYLAEQHRSIADERYLLKRNILNEKFLNMLKAQASSASDSEKAFVRLVLANNAKWTAKTHCTPGYVVDVCSGHADYKGASPSAAIVLEQLKAGGR